MTIAAAMDCADSPSRGEGSPDVRGFYEPRSGSIQYVVSCPRTKACAVIDPVLDYDEVSASTGTACADALMADIASRGLRLVAILDTHPHADHVSAAHHLRERTGVPIAIGGRVREVQALWREIYGFGAEFPVDGAAWDTLYAPGDRFQIGDVAVEVIASPGHTLASVSYVAGDAAFIHDTLLMPDFGTARADFPGGSCDDLWDSIQRILLLPSQTRLFVGHDYRPGGRAPAWESSVAEQRRSNRHLLEAPDRDAFIRLRTARDATLPLPKLMLHALQLNLRAGALPPPDAAGRSFLTIPLNAFPDAPTG